MSLEKARGFGARPSAATPGSQAAVTLRVFEHELVHAG